MRVLVIRLGGVGDVLMALPMLSALRKIEKSVFVTWLCGESVAPLLKTVVGIDELLVIDDRRLLKGRTWEQLAELAGVWQLLFGRRFDLVLTPYLDIRYRLLSLTVVAGNRRSFRRAPGRLGLVHGRYRADEHIRLAVGSEMSGQSAVSELPRLSGRLSDDLQEKLNSLPRPLIALAPGGAHDTASGNPLRLRRWPLESYAALAGRLIARHQGVIVTGSSSDQVASAAFRHLQVSNLIGKTSLTDLLALYGQCDAVVTHDSGPLHVAIAAGVPVVALFGPTNPAEFLPVNARIHVLWGGKQWACSPCYDGKTYAPCSDNACLRSITVDTVLKTLDGALRDNEILR